MIWHLPTKFHRNHSWRSYDIISISKILKIVAIELEIHPGFSFSDSTRLAMSKSISTPNFDRVAQSTAALLLLLILKKTDICHIGIILQFRYYLLNATVIGILH